MGLPLMLGGCALPAEDLITSDEPVDSASAPWSHVESVFRKLELPADERQVRAVHADLGTNGS